MGAQIHSVKALSVTRNHCYSIFTSCTIIIIKTLTRYTKLTLGVDKSNAYYAAGKQRMIPLMNVLHLSSVDRQTCLVLRSAPLVCLALCRVLVLPCPELCDCLHVQSVPIHEPFHVTEQPFHRSSVVQHILTQLCRCYKHCQVWI